MCLKPQTDQVRLDRPDGQRLTTLAHAALTVLFILFRTIRCLVFARSGTGQPDKHFRLDLVVHGPRRRHKYSLIGPVHAATPQADLPFQESRNCIGCQSVGKFIWMGVVRVHREFARRIRREHRQ